jgi:hypothetical protein
VRVAEQRGDADEPVENVLHASAARRATGGQQLAPVGEPDDRANEWQRCDQAHPMLPCQQLELAAQRCEAAGLDLDQQVAADEIDDETADEPFDARVRAFVLTPGQSRRWLSQSGKATRSSLFAWSPSRKLEHSGICRKFPSGARVWR